MSIVVHASLLWCNYCKCYREFGSDPFCSVCGKQFEVTIVK